MTKAIISLLCIFCSVTIISAQNSAPVYQFTNGSWYNGTAFEPATFYTVDGKLTKKIPAKVDSIIDLEGRWVVPPVGDAFCSSVADNPSAEQQLKAYLEEGVFYLQVLGNTQEGKAKVENLLKKTNSPELSFANGGVTCTLGFPFLKYEAPAAGVRNPQQIAEKYSEIRESRKLLGDAYWFVDSKTALNEVWKKLMAQKPDVISIYLLDAENSGGKETKGLSPEMAKAVVKKANRAKLRVFAHVETAADVRLGLKIGVHGFANLPGSNWDGSGDGSKYELTNEDLKKIAKKKIAVVPLFSHAQTKIIQSNALQAQTAQVKLFKRLLENGVNVIAGSDDPQRTIRVEVNYWFQSGNLGNAQILKILCENTPQAIYPNRKIGRLEEGYEANFLILNDNPLTNVLKMRVISFMVHQGKLVKKAG